MSDNGASVLGQNPVPMINDYNLVQNGLAPPPPPQNPNADLPPLLRQIREDYWLLGEAVLQDDPNRDEVEVFFHHWNPDMLWQYKVVRVNGVLARQTWLNGQHVG